VYVKALQKTSILFFKHWVVLKRTS